MNQIQVVKGLEDVELLETECCSFEVTLSHAYVDGSWTKDGTRLKSKPSCRISAQGKKHTLTLTRVSVGDTGVFSFQAEAVQTSARLVVTGTSSCTVKCRSKNFGCYEKNTCVLILLHGHVYACVSFDPSAVTVTLSPSQGYQNTEESIGYRCD